MCATLTCVLELRPIGVVRSALVDPAEAPRQPDEGAPPACLEIEQWATKGLEGLRPGDRIVVVTWLHRASRDPLQVHPRDDLSRPQQGVFATRSQDRPNPIGLHEVEVVAVDGALVRIDALEAVDGTPVLDVKPVLARAASQR